MSIALELLHIAVPLRIMELRGHGGPTPAEWQDAHDWAEEKLGPHGDSLLFKVTGTKAKAEGYDTATMFNELARTLAVMAFVPGGVRFAGMAWNESGQ